MHRVLVLDTSVLCVWLKVPGKDSCGSSDDRWDYPRIDALIQEEIKAGAWLVLPIASLIETGNHISHGDKLRFEKARELGDIIRKTADEKSPWAAFNNQDTLWTREELKRIADEWPSEAAKKLSIGDFTIKNVAEFYARMGNEVEIVTGDAGLKQYQPLVPALIPRRRR